MRQVQRDVASEDPAAALRALERLGWGDSDAHTIPCAGLPALHRLVLGNYPTRATVARLQPNLKTQAIDRMAYFAGHRWCVAVQDGAITWHDFSVAEVWTARASDLTADALQGFTPSFFAQQGRFEPVGVSRALAVGLPKEDATEFLLERVDTWWHRWLADHANPDSVDRERESFVHILSALLLLKTIEDVGRLDWLKTGTLYHAARDGAALPTLLRRSSVALNSRVLRAVADLADDAQHIVPLVSALEESEIDFASLEIDPVGAFYEQVLGTTQTVTESAQGTLPMMGRGQTITDDVSARRRLGAFFTPRSYADVITHQLVLPAVHVARDVHDLPAVLDLAAGSGALLCAALREIFSEKRWRRPAVARTVLADKIWAVDLNRNAVHLAALNVLRTAVQLVPEILDDGHQFPRLDKNFIAGDATEQAVLDAIPTVDIALLNPPFKGRAHWSPPKKGKASVLDELNGPVNLAFAFLAIALDKVRDGGAVGVVMASQLFSGIQHREVREHVAEKLRIETIVINHGSPFPDALSYAGLLLGHRLQGVQLPRAEVINVPGGVRNGAADVGAVLFSASDRPGVAVESHATTTMVPITSHALWNWTGTSTTRKSRTGKSPRIPLASVLHNGIHQGPVAAPIDWGFKLFIFDDAPNGGVYHHGGRKVFEDRTPALRSFSRPRMLRPTVPNLCEPVVANARVFLPGNGDSAGTTLDELRNLDPVAARLAESIRDTVLRTPSSTLSKRGIRFAAELKSGRIRFNWSKSYVDESVPLVVLSKASRSGAGRAQRLNWSAWVNTDGAVVPLDGVFLRTTSLEYAIVVAVLLNVSSATDAVLREAPIRNKTTKQPELAIMSKYWEIPDLSASVYHGILDELVDAFHIYRRAVQSKSPEDAAATSEYKDVLNLGEALWHL